MHIAVATCDICREGTRSDARADKVKLRLELWILAQKLHCNVVQRAHSASPSKHRATLLPCERVAHSNRAQSLLRTECGLALGPWHAYIYACTYRQRVRFAVLDAGYCGTSRPPGQLAWHSVLAASGPSLFGHLFQQLHNSLHSRPSAFIIRRKLLCALRQIQCG